MSESFHFRKAERTALKKLFPKGLSKRILPASKPVSVPVKQYVEKAIKRNEETKCSMRLNIADQAQVLGAGLNTTVSLGWVSPASIIPAITQGTDEASRIGNRIKPVKLQLSFCIRASNVTAAGATLNPFPATPFLCRVIVFRHKYANDDFSQIGILDTGNSMSNLGSTPDNWLQPYNKDEYSIFYSKQWLMQPIKNESTTPATAEQPANGTKSFVMKKVNIKLPKTLIYNDNTSLPTNQNLYMACAICNVDGTVVTSSQTRAMINAESYLYFKDA